MSLELPVKECFAVFLSVLGAGWLFFGRANVVLAVSLALTAGVLVFCLRRWKRRRGGK